MVSPEFQDTHHPAVRKATKTGTSPIIIIAPIALFAWLLQAADPLSPGPPSSPPTVSTPASESPSSSPSSINIYDDRGSRLGYATVHPDGSLDLYRPDTDSP